MDKPVSSVGSATFQSGTFQSGTFQSGPLAEFRYHQPLAEIALAFALGIGTDAMLSVPLWASFGVMLCVVIAWFVGTRWRENARSLRRTLLFLLAVLAAGAWWHGLDRRRDAAATIRRDMDLAAGSDRVGTMIRGRLSNVPKIVRSPMAQSAARRGRSPLQTRGFISLLSIRRGLDQVPVTGRLQWIADGTRDDLRWGDTVEIRGILLADEAPRNPGAKDRRRYSRNQHIQGRIVAASTEHIRHLDDHEATSFTGWLRRLRSTATFQLSRFAAGGREELMQRLGPERGPLMVGLVLGQRDAIPRRVRDDLLATGTVHLLSVSGLHLAIVVWMASLLTAWMRSWPMTRVLVLLTVCVLYMSLTGGRPPVVRASVLVAVLVLAMAAARNTKTLNALSLAALVLLLLDPRHLLDLGVHLSFLAVATLIFSGRGLSRTGVHAVDAAEDIEARLDLLQQSTYRPLKLGLVLIWNRFRSLAWASASVTAVTTPLVWYHFHVISPISVLANLLLSPLLVFALAGGLATVIFAAWAPPLASASAWLASGATGWMLAVVRWAAAVPLGHAWLPSPHPGAVIVFYGVLAATLLLGRGARGRMLRVGWIAIWISAQLFWVTRASPIPPQTLEATFVDVGHGTAVILRCDDWVGLYDAGRLGNDDFRSFDIEDALWKLGVTRIDDLFISHADMDHFNAVPALLRRFDVHRIGVPPRMLEVDEPSVRILRQAIIDSRVPVASWHAGDSIAGFDVLHPPVQPMDASDNANSLVLVASPAGVPVVLPGDLEPPGTEVLASRPRPPPGGVLMAPHHGSLS
ncbi:MAG: ComEC/Rec2 family competence protein, partial [Planctomycetota bacterium]